jgi:two-component system response regulator HydG
MTRILVIDDDADVCALIGARLEKEGYAVVAETSAESARLKVLEQSFDLVVTDVQLGGESGLVLCQWLVENHPDTPVIVVTAFGSLETAVGAIRAGAYDFITKPIDTEILVFAVHRALEHRELKLRVRRLQTSAMEAEPLPGTVGESPAMRKLSALVRRVAESDATVLITGESGTGKELIARAVHVLSRRKNGPFVPVNCAAIPANLLESELFGHTRGAFTDALQAREGLLREASGGTVFLDEIGEMPKEMQAKLLRALQERKCRPVGGDRELPFDARIVAATNRDLEDDVESGRFREDLYYRINVVRLHVPPLRSRSNDVILLAQWLLRRIADRSGREVKGLGPAAARRLLDYDWPGNVRELENAIERAVAVAQYDELTADDLPERIRKHQTEHVVVSTEDPAELLSLSEIEKRYILRVLRTAGGNKTEAARILGLDRRTLHRKLRRWEQEEEGVGVGDVA